MVIFGGAAVAALTWWKSRSSTSSTGAGMLSPHFSLAELTRTSTGLPNEPTPEALVNLQRLAVEVLEPIREHFGPVIVSSAYRGELVNAAVGGVAGSTHTEGRGADIFVEGVTNNELAEWLGTRTDLPLEEVIVEEHTGHLHVALDEGPAPGARQFLVTNDGETYASFWT